VGYLGTVLSEMRDRTWVGTDGSKHDGAAMIGRMWDAALERSTNEARAQFLAMSVGEIRHAIDGRTDADDLFDEFLSFGSVQRHDDGTWFDSTDARRAGLREPAR
jgi:hypothetical protein